MHRKHLMPFGAEISDGGVRFALWAPSAERIELVNGDRRIAMPPTGQGWYKLADPAAKPGDRYGFAVDGAAVLVPDPCSRFQQDDRDRRSTVVDPQAYDWQDGGWNGRPWHEVVLCELHLGTATTDGTFASLEEKLTHFQEAGISAIELMPLAETSGRRTWGYDGVLPFAPNNAYGEPTDLKRLVDKAHGLGLMVFLDVVYNHFGPSGNFLHSYAESFFNEAHSTPWGAAINFDGRSESSEVVREFFIHNALYWLEEFHIDGLRFDAVHAIVDEGDRHFLAELAERIRDTFPGRHVHLVLENEHNEAHWLARDGDNKALAYDAQWDDDYHHCWHVLLTGEDEGYYGDFAGDTVERLGRCLAEGFAYQGDYSPNLKRIRGESTAGLPPEAFVAFIQNHDQIGNRAEGDRLTSLAAPERARLARAVLYLGPLIPMIFMGDEWGTQTPFQFFVNFEHEYDLEQAIRKGRAKEFESFKAFAGNGSEAKVPDPTIVETFERSKIDWSELACEPHARILEETRHLLALRQAEIVPLMASGFIESRYERIGHGGLVVEWRFRGGSVCVVTNFSDDVILHEVPADVRILWKSESLVNERSASLTAWTGIIFRTAAP